MKIREIARRNYLTARTVAQNLFGNEFRGMDKAAFYRFIAKNDVDVQMEDRVTIAEMVSTVNRQVKHATCPNNYKNRFYALKHRYIRECIVRGDVDHVLESENCYHFFMKDGHDYHQLKNSFPGGVGNITGQEEYVPVEHNIPFDEEFFRKTVVQMTLFMHNGEKMFQSEQKQEKYDSIISGVSKLVKEKIAEGPDDEMSETMRKVYAEPSSYDTVWPID